MKALRQNIVPVAFLALWVAASGYTIHSLDGLRSLRVVRATMDMTVTAPAQSPPNASCPEARNALTPGMG
jgi:hypothetical protein